MRRMRFGLSFPNFGAFAEPSTLVDVAVRAEDAGWVSAGPEAYVA